MKSGTWWDEAREVNAFTAPNKPGFEPHSFSLRSAVEFPGCQGPLQHAPQMQQQIRRHRKKQAGGALDSRETKDKHNHILHNKVQNCARCAKMPDPLSKRSSWAWTVEQSGLDRGQTVWL